MEVLIPTAQQLTEFGPRFFSGIMMLLVFAILWLTVHAVFARVKKHLTPSKQYVTHFLEKICSSVIWIIAIISILGTWGVDVRALVAGLGLTGFALGFAFKDVLSNALSGVMILLYQPFKLHDHIKALGVTGEIITIDMRYTTIKDGSEKHLLPNAKLLSEKVTILQKNKK